MMPEPLEQPVHESPASMQRRDGRRENGYMQCCCTVFVMVLAAATLAGCTTSGGRILNLMPPPDALASAETSPFRDDRNPFQDIPYRGVLYATDREPDTADGALRYLNERGGVVRLGAARVSLGKEDIDWEEARRISLLKNRPRNYPLKVTSIEEYGILDRSIHSFLDPDIAAGYTDTAEQVFTDAVNDKLSTSRQKDIIIYVHGYKVVFENPVLVTAELWHFLGYEGVTIAYSWPATPERTAYFSDVETADVASVNFRHFLRYLADSTHAQRIHIVAYSAGTRMVARALQDLALLTAADPEAAADLKLGAVVLTGSDIDRQRFGAYLQDGILDVVEELVVYTSATDKALGMSKWLLGRRNRLGEAFASLEENSPVARYVRSTPGLTVINVTGAEGADTGNGHGYFRSSPWISSDILTRIRWGLSPYRRGLVRNEETGIWSFPDDYVERLRDTLLRVQQETL